MNKQLIFIAVFSAVVFGFGLLSAVSTSYAQFTDSGGGDHGGGTYTTADLGVPNVGLLPTSKWYFLKEWRRGLERLFTRNPIAKAELELNIVNEKVAEALKVEETKPDDADALTKALSNYERAHERLKARFEALKETSKNPNVEKLLDRLDELTEKHIALFHELKETHAEKKNIRDELNRAQEKIQETVVKAAEVIARHKTNPPEPFLSQEQIIAAQQAKRCEENYRSKLNYCESSAALSESDCRRRALADYQECLKGVHHFLNPPQIILPQPVEKIQQPAPPTVKEEPRILCTQEWNPVCGADGKTYSNECTAKSAGVEVKYKGECGAPSTIKPEAGIAPTTEQPTAVAPAFYEFKLEADDLGFYPEPTITAPRGSRVKIHFTVRTANVYYGGLDFRSSKFKTGSVKPGGTADVEFIADESFMFTSYWPLSDVQKASGKVVAQ